MQLGTRKVRGLQDNGYTVHSSQICSSLFQCGRRLSHNMKACE